jgi:hypothetical protein
MKSLCIEVSSGIFERISLEDLIKDGSSLIEFLSFLDIGDIEEHVQANYYERKPQHNVGAMLRLSVVYYFYGDRGYGRIIESLTEHELRLLKLKKPPSPSALHHFIHCRIGESGFMKLMEMIAPKLDKFAEQNGIKHLSQDSTPVEASRYDKNADYNPHYQCMMYKAHITMKGTIPLLMTFSSGNSGDSPYLNPHAYKLNELGITGEFMDLDSAYDSFENHALVKHVIGAYPYIGLKETSVMHDEGKLEAINHWCNKLWKEGGNSNAPMNEKLDFLFEQGRIEQVGMYYRNKNLRGMPKDKTDLRAAQERIHSHIKGTVKFDVRNRQNSKKSLHLLAAFVSYQLLVLAALQNGLNPNEFGFIRM